MTDDQLILFVRVACLQSFHRAAEFNFISVSTVSRQMAALEKELGVKLLRRSPNGVLLTQAGEVFFDHARKLMNDIRMMKNAVLATENIPGPSDSVLSIASYPASSYYRRLFEYIHLLPAYSIKRRLTMYVSDRGKIVYDVLAGWADMGIVREFELAGHEDEIDSVKFDRDYFNILAHKGSALYGRRGMDLSEITGKMRFSDFFLPEKLYGVKDAFIETPKDICEIGRLTCFGCPDLTSVLREAAGTGKPIILPSVIEYPGLEVFRRIDIGNFSGGFNIVLFWRKQTENTDVLRFADIIRNKSVML